MVRFDYIKKAKANNDFEELVKCGLISVHLKVWFEIYSEYQKELVTNKKSTAIQFLQDKHQISQRTVYKIIDFMET